MDIHILQTDPAVELAGHELARCLGEMTDRQIEVVEGGKPGPQPDIYLGTGESLGELAELPDVDDPRWDDAYTLRTVDESLVIAGVNPRSVLMGVYGYLRELGAEWLWPGEDGEVLPRIEQVPLQGFDAIEVPPNRHRGVCIEGAPSLEHVLNMVEWMPKVGMNSYFLQFQVAAYFWRLWYAHALNPTWEEPRDLSYEECEQLHRQVIAALKQRDMLLHQVGHGWTAAALGLPSSGWVEYDGEISEEMRELMAQVDGQRGLWGGIPINTELCYGNPEARRRVIDTLLDYARNHPEVDALHFWLSDAPNNHCECELCRDYGPWDWYATLINELSAPLKEVAPDMKLVIIAYHDLLWPPEKVELDTSHNNLIVMFAPISRCYGHSLADPGCGEEPSLQRPARNEMDTPRENRSLVWLWQQWDWTDRANCFVFDYHFYRCPWMGDGLSVDLPAVISQDIADYAELGLGGLINCQVQRVFYPTGWPLFMTARLLAGETLSADERFRYFSYAYGANALTALDFLEGVRQVSDCPFGGAEWCHQVKPERLQQMREFLRAQEPRLVGAAEDAESPTQHRSWQLLLHYYELLSRFITAQEFREIGDLDAAVAQIEDIEEFVRRTEPETARALDSYLLLVNLSNLRKQWSE